MLEGEKPPILSDDQIKGQLEDKDKLPTKETSVFQDADIARASEIFAEFITAHKAKIRENIIQRMLDEVKKFPARGEQFQEAWSKMAQTTGDHERTAQYEWLINKISEEFEKQKDKYEKFIAERALNPEKIRDLPEMIKIVNKVITDKLPQYRDLFLLDPKDLKIFDGKTYPKIAIYHQQQNQHPFMNEIDEIITKDKNQDLLDVMPALATAFVSHSADDKNIYISQEMFDQQPYIDKLAKDMGLLVAKIPDFAVLGSATSLIIHELYHRATSEKEVHDEKLREHISGFIFEKRFNEDSEDEAFRQKYSRVRQIYEYFKNLPVEKKRIYFKGAMIIYEVDGKTLTMGGINLEEAINDLLNPRLRAGFIRKFGKHYGLPNDVISEMVKSTDVDPLGHIQLSKSKTYDKKQTMEILSDLGLNTEEKILEAYLNGKIPELYFAKYPNGQYFD